MTVLVVGGALIWYGPPLTRSRQVFAEIPTPAALGPPLQYPVPAHGQACMALVTVTPDSRLAAFQLFPAKRVPTGGPPVELTLSAAGYHSSALVPGGYPGGSASVPITPPRRAVLTTACFVNRGRTTVLLAGTTQPQTVSRSANVVIDGRPVPGDVALAFLEGRPTTLLAHLGEIFQHASNLTDGLLPPWAIWAFAILAALGVPSAVTFAFYVAVRDDGGRAG
jgi:hypothetical protein